MLIVSCQKMNEIAKLWEEFQSRPFPDGIAGEEINGVEPVEIDTFTAGCVSTYVGNKGSLDIERINILKKCMSELEAILPELNSEGKEYFSILQKLGNLILSRVANSS